MGQLRVNVAKDPIGAIQQNQDFDLGSFSLAFPFFMFSHEVGVASPISAEIVAQRHHPEVGATFSMQSICRTGRTAVKTNHFL